MAYKKAGPAGQLNFSFESDSGEKTTAKRVKKTEKRGKGRKKPKKSDEKRPPKKAKIKDKNVTVRQQVQAKTSSQPISDDQIAARAELMASSQREISVSEFFAKNRHLLGFDNPSKALLTAIKEAVDNSLDACEEANILPEIEVGIRAINAAAANGQTGQKDRFLIWVQDNGPGIVKEQIPNIFGRLLYGSKFHTLRMARGQQGIGISAAGMYGMLTTGKSVKINSKTGPTSPAHYYELRIDTKKNRPEIIADKVIDWNVCSGTRVEIELEGRYQRGRQSVDEYLAQTAITNPHARIRYLTPDSQEILYERSVKQVVSVPKAIKPHPYGVELGVLIKMLKDTDSSTMASFLCREFSRISPRVSQQLLEKAKISPRKRPRTLAPEEVEKLYTAINETKIMAPSTDCVVPIGPEELLKGLRQVVVGDFYAACTRPPAVYRGNPFQIEAALAYGKENPAVYDEDDEDQAHNHPQSPESAGQELMRVLRFANRVPLLYQQSACAIYKAIMQTNWRLYGLSQSKGALPAGPVTVIVHIASVWVPFTSESKEAVAHYPEIIKEIKLALSDCGRKLGRYLRGQKHQREEALKRTYIEKYLPAIGEALRDILTLKDQQVKKVLTNLEYILEHSRGK